MEACGCKDFWAITKGESVNFRDLNTTQEIDKPQIIPYIQY